MSSRPHIHLATGAIVAIVTIVVALIFLVAMWLVSRTNRPTTKNNISPHSSNVRLPKHGHHFEGHDTVNLSEGRGDGPLRFFRKKGSPKARPFRIQLQPVDVNTTETGVDAKNDAGILGIPFHKLATSSDRAKTEPTPLTDMPSKEDHHPAVARLSKIQIPGLKSILLHTEGDAPNVNARLQLRIRPGEDYSARMSVPKEDLNPSSSRLVHASELPHLSLSPRGSTPLSEYLGLSLQVIETDHDTTHLHAPSSTSSACQSCTNATHGHRSRKNTDLEKHAISEAAEDVKTQGDVIGVGQYEREEYSIHTRRSSGMGHSPISPSTPKLFLRPVSTSSIPIAIPNESFDQWSSSLCAALEDACEMKSLGTENRPSQIRMHDDYCPVIPVNEQVSIHAATSGLRTDITTGEDALPNSQDMLPPYQGLAMDFETRLASKRDPTSSARSTTPAVSDINIPAQEAAPVVRPRPPPVDFEPLVLRRIDPSKSRTETLLPTVSLQSLSPSTSRKTSLEIKTEISGQQLALSEGVSQEMGNMTADMSSENEILADSNE